MAYDDYRHGSVLFEGSEFHNKAVEIVQSAPAAPVADANHWNGSLSFSLDEDGDTLLVTAKYSDGTVKTGTVALS